MCGICGVIGVDDPRTREAVVRCMMAALHHRGPDDDALLATPSATLGMRRLSIIDLPGGHQPVWNEDGTLALVFNGEIYNFRDLRRTLESQGHRFRTRSDTEVIVHAYESWGDDCVQHLRGMFAFAVLELPHGPGGFARRIFLARDRLGIKPLYYAHADGVFLFASEVRALLASGILAPRISPAALEAYLLFGSVSEPTTLVKGILSLPPGHRLSISVDVGQPVTGPQCYWRPTEAITRSEASTEGHIPPAKTLRSRLEESIRGHLIADVPLGIFLSSGIDSTALAALASREQSGIRTFTVVFPERHFSEAELARRTAERFRTQHQELLLSGEEMRERLDGAIAAFDQPSMDGINTYFVSWAARQAGLKVALSGLGSDELFGGYPTFRSAPRVQGLAALSRWVPDSARRAMARALVETGKHRGQADAAGKLASAWATPEALPHPYFFTRALFVPERVASLLKDSASAEDASTWRAWLGAASREAAQLDRVSSITWLELRSYLANTLLRDTDAMSMSQSLEVRVPFLDHLLLEYVMSLPEPAKRRGKITKALLVEALADLLPAEVVQQRKRTFTFPWKEWLREALRERVAESLENLTPALQPLLNETVVRSVWQEFLAGHTSWSRPWSLYVLNEWVRRNLEGTRWGLVGERYGAATSAT